LADLYLVQGDSERALHHAREACWRSDMAAAKARATLIASAYVACARVQFERREFEAARKTLDELYDFAEYAPTDLARAALLIAAGPNALLQDDDPDATYFVSLASNLARYAGSEALVEGSTSPICRSALGAAMSLEGKHAKAVGELERAMAERAESWPRSADAHRLSEDARDLYLLAMARVRMSAGEDGGPARDAPDVRDAFAAADEAWRRLSPVPGPTTIVSRTRTAAHALRDADRGQ
jgi:hypothetical protein